MMEDVCTGDVCLFSRNDTRGVLMRFTMNTIWYHTGIAVRLDEENNIVDKGGELHILEILSGKRYDAFEDKIVRGFGLTRFTDAVNSVNGKTRYNLAAFRRLKITIPGLHDKIREFHKEHVGLLFHDNKTAFLKLWMQTTIFQIDPNKRFCTQSCSEFYRHITGFTHQEIFCNNDKFVTDELITPKMFSYKYSNGSKLFEDEEEKIFYFRQTPIMEVVWGPLLLLILIIIVICVCIYFVKWLI